MHYYAPERPRLPNGFPQYLWQGKIMAAISSLTLIPTEDGQWDVMIMLKTSDRGHSWHTVTMLASMVPEFLAAWLADPEQVMADTFSYKGPGEPDGLPDSPQTLSVEDLL